MEVGFEEQYHEFLHIAKKRLVFSQTEFGNQKGIRIDRILELQLKDSLDVLHNSGKTLQLSVAYKYNPKTANKLR